MFGEQPRPLEARNPWHSDIEAPGFAKHCPHRYILTAMSSPATVQPASPSLSQLISALQEAAERTRELVGDLSDEQMIGPRMDIVNPLRWEVGHVAWFQEYWVLRHLNQQSSLLAEGDRIYDSARVAHDTRWDLPLPSKARTLEYKQQILDRIADHYRNPAASAGRQKDGYDDSYFLHLALFHEQMHAEAITYTRQTLRYAALRLSVRSSASGADNGGTELSSVQALGDAHVPGGTFLIGCNPGAPFVFDNEQWAHVVEMRPFAIARTALTNSEFAAFVGDGGYRRRELWTDEGWQWRERAGAEQPVYWHQGSGSRWSRRNFDALVPLEDDFPVLHVNWHEATAYCRWAKRRLPTEAEWEVAAAAELAPDGRTLGTRKRQFPWGDEAPTPERANLDWRARACLSVQALPAGDSAFGCRQMIGNTWEWTASDFGAYPGFVAGPYKEYSAPWFETHKVLRGGCWATRSALIHNTYRNYYTPDRRDVWAGFRTCAL